MTSRRNRTLPVALLGALIAAVSPVEARGANARFDIAAMHVAFSADQSTGAIDIRSTVTVRANSAITQVEFDFVTLPTLSVADAAGTPLSFVSNPMGVGVVLPGPLQAGQLETIVIRSAGVAICDDSQPWYRCEVSARLVFFNNFDYLIPRNPWDPVLFSSVTLDVQTPPGFVAAATGQPAGTDDHTSHLVHHFTAWPLMSVVSLAFARYETATSLTSDLKPVTTYVYDGDVALGPTWAARAAEALDLFGSLFGPYAFGRLDLLQTTSGLGGAQNNASTVIFDHVEFTPSHRDLDTPYDDMLLAHEISHCWWGWMVRNADPSSPWLDEGLATYSAYLLDERRWPDLMPRFYRADFEQFFFMLDPADELPLTSTDLDSAKLLPYMLVTYTKGGHFLRMLQWLVGDEAFFAGLKLYVQQNRWDASQRRATVDSLRAAIEAAAGRSLQTFFEQWARGTGYPILQYATKLGPSAGGGFAVDLRVDQVQSTGLFDELPLEIKIYVAGERAPRARRLVMKGAALVHRFELDQEPLRVTVDESWWLWADKRPALVGDVDSSSEVDGVDLIRVAWAQGSAYPRPNNVNVFVESPYLWEADLDRDGTIDAADLDRVLQGFGEAGRLP